MRVAIYVRNVYFRTIEVPDHYKTLDLHLKDPTPFAMDEYSTSLDDSLSTVRCHIEEYREKDAYNDLYYTLYRINIEDEDVVIWDHESLKRIGNKKKYESSYISGEVDSRFEILDL